MKKKFYISIIILSALVGNVLCEQYTVGDTKNKDGNFLVFYNNGVPLKQIDITSQEKAINIPGTEKKIDRKALLFPIEDIVYIKIVDYLNKSKEDLTLKTSINYGITYNKKRTCAAISKNEMMQICTVSDINNTTDAGPFYNTNDYIIYDSIGNIKGTFRCTGYNMVLSNTARYFTLNDYDKSLGTMLYRTGKRLVTEFPKEYSILGFSANDRYFLLVNRIPYNDMNDIMVYDLKNKLKNTLKFLRRGIYSPIFEESQISEEKKEIYIPLYDKNNKMIKYDTLEINPQGIN
jgi:hypothetical protein